MDNNVDLGDAILRDTNDKLKLGIRALKYWSVS